MTFEPGRTVFVLLRVEYTSARQGIPPAEPAAPRAPRTPAKRSLTS
jgi:hypothetical protein